MPDKAALFFYLGTFGLLVAAGLGLPIPEEIPIVAAGAGVGHAAEPSELPLPPELLTAFSGSYQAGFPANLPWFLVVSNDLDLPDVAVSIPRASPLPSSLRWYIMLPVCIIGAVISDVFLYGIGRLGGPRLLKNRWVVHLLKPEKRERIEQNFHEYGVLVLVFARFLPTIRSPIFIMAGIMRVKFTRFVLADGLAGCVGVSLLFTLAFWFGDSFRDLIMRAEGRVERLKPLLILLAITVVGTYLVFHFLKHPVATGNPSEELPLLGTTVAAKIAYLPVQEEKTEDNNPVPKEASPSLPEGNRSPESIPPQTEDRQSPVKE